MTLPDENEPETFDELEPSAAEEPVLEDLLDEGAAATPRTGFGALSPTAEEIASFQEFAGRIGEATKSAFSLPPSFKQGVKGLVADVKDKVAPAKADDPSVPLTPSSAGEVARAAGDPLAVVVHLSQDVFGSLARLADYRRISMERLLQGLAEDEAFRLGASS